MTEMVFSGFGGQGVLTTGLIMADAALAHDMYATWIPSYGAEMRGGKANCVVKIDDEQVGTPSLEAADILVAMNIPSLVFAERVRPGGIVIVDSDFIPDDPKYSAGDGLRSFRIPFASLARQAENSRGGNVVTVGVIAALLDYLDREKVELAMAEFFAEKGKDKFREANIRAYNVGYDYMKKLLAG